MKDMKVYLILWKNKSEEFLKEIEDIKKDNPELKDFNE